MRFRSLVVVVVVSSLAALAFAGAASAKGRPKHGHIKPDLAHVPKLQAIPAELVAAFPVFNQPAVRAPDVVLRTFQDSRTVQMFGTDPRQARAITGLRGGTWYAIPGTKGICLFADTAAGTCTVTANATAGKLMFFTPARDAGDVGSFMGLAPIGFQTASALLQSGATTTIPITPSGAYRLDAVGPFKTFSLTRAVGDPVVLAGVP
ncbi:hypothetical protein [Conexibacter woesei]|uniref:hypothetical protein n=1 Tax=Conexibacter woesei TaxID=191495 RepID=UPI00041EE3E8|nr:hypothetical protein [Conexibacter woesei]